MSKGTKVLLLEDDEALALGIKYSLIKEGYEVEHIATYEEGIKWLDSYNPDQLQRIALFDVMLPDGNGFDLLTAYRGRGIEFPVIFLTAVADEINVVQGLDIGADDYISKPFRVKELMSRINAVLRRYYRDNVVVSNHIISYRDILINEQTATVQKRTQKEYITIELTPNEYKLLLLFIHNQGILLERNLILERLFDANGTFVDNNTLSVYIRRLRDKLGDNDKTTPYIKTVHGVGYTMEK